MLLKFFKLTLQGPSISVRASDKRIHCDEEFSDSEDEFPSGETGGRRDRVSFKQKPKRIRTEGEKKEGGTGTVNQLSLCLRKPTICVPTRSDTNRSVKAQKMVRGWKFWM